MCFVFTSANGFHNIPLPQLLLHRWSNRTHTYDYEYLSRISYRISPAPVCACKVRIYIDHTVTRPSAATWQLSSKLVLVWCFSGDVHCIYSQVHIAIYSHVRIWLCILSCSCDCIQSCSYMTMYTVVFTWLYIVMYIWLYIVTFIWPYTVMYKWLYT